MKTAEKQVSQGDLYFTRVAALPDGVTEVKTRPFVLAGNSQSGRHTAEGKDIKFYTQDQFTSYLVLGSENATINHAQTTSRHHLPFQLASSGSGTVWRVRKQRESVPGGYRQVQD